MDGFEKIAIKLAELQAEIGDLSIQIAEITMQLEDIDETTIDREELNRQKSAYETKMTHLQQRVRSIMKKMEQAANE